MCAVVSQNCVLSKIKVSYRSYDGGDGTLANYLKVLISTVNTWRTVIESTFEENMQ